VHEHDQVEAARLRHDHLGRRRSDEPIEEHEGVAWDPLDDRFECGKRSQVAAGPRTGDGVLVHGPVGRREAAGESAVVDVASARPGGVVDAVGHDEVHRRHSGRS
jgi:hypothetical protein